MKASMSCLLKTLLAIFAFSLFSLPSSAKDVVYVRSGADGDGSSWTNAFGNLQQAVDSAEKKGADVWVAKGVYYAMDDNQYVVDLKPNVNLYGGFAGDEASLADRDTAKNPTVLDGGSKVRVLRSENNFDDSQAVAVDGFTIQNGVSVGAGALVSGNVTINNCIIRNNVSDFGGIIYALGSKNIIKNTQIIGNSSNDQTIFFYNDCVMDSCVVKGNEISDLTVYCLNSVISNCVFDGNINKSEGYRGFYFSWSQLNNCKFINAKGGGAPVYMSGSSEMKNCLFQGNTDLSNYLIYTEGLIEDCRIIDNSSNHILLYFNRAERCIIKENTIFNRYLFQGRNISNSLIVDNKVYSTEYNESAIYISGDSMSNCTVVNNESYGNLLNIDATLINSIVVGNKPKGNTISFEEKSMIVNNMLESTYVKGNLVGSLESVAFADPKNGDYSLSRNSCCIDLGVDVSQTSDLFGNNRNHNGKVDLGAIESSYTSNHTFNFRDTIYVKPGSKGDGSSWNSAVGDVQEALKLAHNNNSHQIWVAAGTYFGDTTSLTAFNLAPGICMYGGFAGNETSISDRDIVKNLTILDGAGLRRVVKQDYDFPDSLVTVIDGFTIQNGFVDGDAKIVNKSDFRDHNGNFIYSDGSNAKTMKNSVFRNCIFKNAKGGNVGVSAEKTTFSNCKFIGNTIRTLDILDGIVDSSSFTGIQSQVGINLLRSRMKNSEISGNVSYYDLLYSLHSSISRCKFTNNESKISSIIFLTTYENRFLYYDHVSNRSELNNSLVYANVSNSNVVNISSGTSVTNSTIVHNISKETVPIICSSLSEANFSTLSNTIIYGNKSENDTIPQIVVSGFTNVVNCASDSELKGENNIKLSIANNGSDTTENYVGFVNSVDGDFRLHQTSACINKGTADSFSDTVDINGNTRIYGEILDIGAIEYNGENFDSFKNYRQVLCSDKSSEEVDFASIATQIEWKVVKNREITGLDSFAGSGSSIPSMKLINSRNDLDSLTLLVTPYNKYNVACAPFYYNYVVYPDMSKEKVNFVEPHETFVENDQSTDMTIEWNSIDYNAGDVTYELYVWKTSVKMPSIPIQSIKNENNKEHAVNYIWLSNLSNRTTYKYMVKAITACDTICSDIDTFRINIPVFLELNGGDELDFGSKLNESTTLIRNINAQGMEEPITFVLTGDTSDFIVVQENDWDIYTGGNIKISYKPTDIKKTTSEAELLIKSGNYETKLYLNGTLSNYYVYDVVVGNDVYDAGDSVDVVGILTDAYGNPMSGKVINIEATSNTGFVHKSTCFTDSTGKAYVKFATDKNECGTYIVKMYSGTNHENVAFSEFSIPGMAYSGGDLLWEIQKGDTIDGTVSIINKSSIDLHNVFIEARELADGLSVEFEPLSVLKGNETTAVRFKATGTKLTDGEIFLPNVFRVSCDENITFDFLSYFYCVYPYGQIKVFPSRINEYVSKQKAKNLNIELTNLGFGETGDITLSLPDFPGLSIASTNLPSIKSGDTVNVSLQLSYFPSASINVPYTGTIVVNCANGKSTNLPFNIEYTSESNGSLELDIVDEYFYNTTSKKHLSGAKVMVYNKFDGSEIVSGYSDSSGVVRIDSIPEGTYLMKVTAEKHSEFNETIVIQAGQKLEKFVFLSYRAITYSWKVERNEIEDKYDIKLDFEYETNVPAPVVSVAFPNGVPDKDLFEVGVPKTVTLQITNHGLIAARYVNFGIQKCHGYRFFVPFNSIDSLPANYTEFVPVTILRIDDNEVEGNNSYGIPFEMSSLGESECPHLHAEYSYHCGLLRQMTAVVKNPWTGCDSIISLETMANNNDDGKIKVLKIRPIDIFPYIDIPEKPTDPVYFELDCCHSKIDSWGCVANDLGYIPGIGILVSGGVEAFHALAKADEEARYRELSCEVEQETDNYDFFAGMPAHELVKHIKEKNDGLLLEAMSPYLDNIAYVYDWFGHYSDMNISTFCYNLHTYYKQVKLLDDYQKNSILYDFQDELEIIYSSGKSICSVLPFTKYIPFECSDLICQMKSCDSGLYAEDCAKYRMNKYLGKTEDTRNALTTNGDTVVIVKGEIVDVLYKDGHRMSDNESSNIYEIEKAKFAMPNSFYQTADNRALAAKDALELFSFMRYKGNIFNELAGSDSLLSKLGILDYFDYTIKHYSRRKKINIDSIKSLPTKELSTTEMIGMAKRWNETLVANENGVYSPNDDYPNIIDRKILKVYMDSIVTFYTYLGLRHYMTPDDMMMFINAEANKPLKKSVCASVKLQMSQTMTMTREAFDGTLTVSNGNESGAMENFKVVIEIRDDKGELANDLFQINTEKLTGISAVDGTGEIASMSEGSALFRFIPTKMAAPVSPKNYSFGGYISYVDPASGDTVKADLYPVTLTVNPSPDLQIDYFMQRNILGDDALTLDRVEPSIPAALGVRIDNQGYGLAKNVKLETAQPEIVDNEKGLLIDFDIIGSSMDGKDCDLGSENINFGNIEPQSSKTGVWWMTSSLLGHFTKYDASVVHANSFGNPELSLVNGVSIHELIKTVDAYGAKEDGVSDFLVNDHKDAKDTPDAIYYSNGGKDTVKKAKSVDVDVVSLSLSDSVVTLSVVPSGTGWNYAQIADPGDNFYEIKRVVRLKDNVEIPLSNVWLTFVTLPDGEDPIYENRLHFLDYMSTIEQTDYDIYYSIRKNILKVEDIYGTPESEGTDTLTVDSVIVTFNRKIQIESFDYNDMELYCQAGENLADSTIVVEKIDDYRYKVDISSKTKSNGYYKFVVNVNNVYDEAGYPGEFGKSASWVQFVLNPDTLIPVNPDVIVNDSILPIVPDTIVSEDDPDDIKTSMEVDENDEFMVYSYQNSIYVKSSKSGSFDIYDVLSCMVAKDVHYGVGVSRVATLPKGVYIINGKKVIVQ